MGSIARGRFGTVQKILLRRRPSRHYCSSTGRTAPAMEKGDVGRTLCCWYRSRKISTVLSVLGKLNTRSSVKPVRLKRSLLADPCCHAFVLGLCSLRAHVDSQLHGVHGLSFKNDAMEGTLDHSDEFTRHTCTWQLGRR